MSFCECPWKDRCPHPVGGEGPLDSPLMLVGRNPGAQEARLGRPFVGPAGAALDGFLRDAGIDRKKVYVSNTAKCYGGDSDPCPTEDVFNACENRIESEILTIHPVLIIPFGADAYRRLTQDRTSILSIEGRLRKLRHQPTRLYFPVTHPSYWLRSSGYYQRWVFPNIVPVLRKVLEGLRISHRVNNEIT